MKNLIFLVACIYKIIISVESMEVMTTLGPIRGKLVDDPVTKAYYYSFEGIPYAEPPVGNLRFKPPVLKQPWTTVLDATKPGYVCPQIELIYPKKEMNEDCLNFNIYTPANFLNKYLPVMVYIHTGAFKVNSGRAEPINGPQYLILNDIIVVTMNYRLGALGFLSLCTKEASGNAGLKDILLVLNLVQKNIKKFGGDPNKITLAGHGAGSALAHYLMLTNQSQGLFQQVMLHSGSVLSERYAQLKPRENAILLGKELGLKCNNERCLLKKLRSANVFEIVEAQEAIARKDPQRGYNIFDPFKPTVEIESPTAIITRPPLEMIREGEILNIPIFIGFNNQEGLEVFLTLREEPELIDEFNKNIELLVPADIEYPYGSRARKNLASRIIKFYFNNKNISYDNIQNYINLVTDTQYTFSIDYFIKMFKDKKTAPVYYYVFEVDAALNWYKVFSNITYPGACHDDDIGYVFFTSAIKSRYQNLDPNTKYILASIMYNVKYFIYYGAPTPNPNIKCWPETGKERYHLIQGCKDVVIFNRPLPTRIGFWYSVYEEYFSSKFYGSSYFFTNDTVRSVT